MSKKGLGKGVSMCGKCAFTMARHLPEHDSTVLQHAIDEVERWVGGTPTKRQVRAILENLQDQRLDGAWW